jgi:hypothetical protein
MVSTTLYTLMFLLMCLAPASGHIESSAGCCGDIPDSLIWFMSFFVLVGFVIIAISYFSSDPSYNGVGGSDCSRPAIIARIDPRDLKKIERMIQHEIP